jgi:hypothetical protein
MFLAQITSNKYDTMWKDGVSPSFDVWACNMLVLSCFEMIAPQLKLLPEIATVYSRGIHASENLDQSFSSYSREIRAIK